MWSADRIGEDVIVADHFTVQVQVATSAAAPRFPIGDRRFDRQRQRQDGAMPPVVESDFKEAAVADACRPDPAADTGSVPINLRSPG